MRWKEELEGFALKLSIIGNGQAYLLLTIIRDNDDVTIRSIRKYDREHESKYCKRCNSLEKHGLIERIGDGNTQDRYRLTEKGKKILHYADRIAEEMDYTNP